MTDIELKDTDMAKAGSRPGATAKKKGATKGTGGHGRRALEGKGPTPKAEDRVYHKAYKMKRAAERRAATGTNRKFRRVWAASA